jgi:hypothetical protein
MFNGITPLSEQKKKALDVDGLFVRVQNTVEIVEKVT